MFIIDEIFKSINGETTMSGTPTTFIRLTGCNIKCVYCDTKEQNKIKMSMSEVIEKVISLGVKNVCITGGEPMLNPNTEELARILSSVGYDVYIETNGSIYLKPIGCYRYIMDIKCPSSGVEEHNMYSNLSRLKSTDEVKFVIADRKDFDFAMQVLREFPTEAVLLFSPMFKDDYTISDDAKHLVDWLMKEEYIPNKWRVQIQIHKLLGAK